MLDEKIPNLDYYAAQHAQKIVADGADENDVTKALGVLQENGVYACFLYLLANDKEKIVSGMLDLLQTLEIGKPPENKKASREVLQYVANDITSDLPRLLLAKEALEQTLIYARYGAKARDKGGKS